jgi:hypothetical protein
MGKNHKSIRFDYRQCAPARGRAVTISGEDIGTGVRRNRYQGRHPGTSPGFKLWKAVSRRSNSLHGGLRQGAASGYGRAEWHAQSGIWSEGLCKKLH